MPGYDLPSRYWTQEAPFHLEGGASLPRLRIAYELWGEAAPAEAGTVVILHALSGSSHAASSPDCPEPGWWERLIEEGSPISQRTHRIICANLLGSCYGTTGPASVDPGTGRRYGARFPAITTGDMIEAYRALLLHLGLGSKLTLIGGSLGGMLALEWAVRHPAEVRSAISIVAPGWSAAQAIAFRSVQRDAILNDPDWNGGDCYEGRFPMRGLSLARKIGMIVYRSAAEFEQRFHRAERTRGLHFLEGKYEVQSYLDHQGQKFCGRFDPNTYLYFSRAMDLYDLARGHASLDEALRRIEARVLLLSVDSDVLVPSREVETLQRALEQAGAASQHEVIESSHGHDAFLIEIDQLHEHLRRFLGGS